MSISAVVDRLVALIKTVPDIGVVHKVDPRDHDDPYPLVVSEINGIPTLRAWWISGPELPESVWLPPMSPPHIRREWTYAIHGIEGVAPGFEGDTRKHGEDLLTLRDNALAVMDAIDLAEVDLGIADHVFESQPCRWTQAPRHSTFGPAEARFSAGWVTIAKPVTTVTAT